MAICDEVLPNKNGINLAGKFSLLESAALVKECDLMICNDSGGLHIANAMKTDIALARSRRQSAAEMAALYAQRGADGIVYGLVSRWRMDEASPGTVVSGAGAVKDDVGDNHATSVATPEYAKSELSRKRAA